jgi:kynurenine formamidase
MSAMEQRLPPMPTDESLRLLLTERNNWGRWGPDDQYGALNLITPDKRVQAARLVTAGRTVTLSSPIVPNVSEEEGAARCDVFTIDRGNGAGAAMDHFGLAYHGFGTTHLDALCHVWQDGAMWNGRTPEEEVHAQGATWGTVEHWRDGIVTRGLLADVPAARGTSYVTPDEPVHGWELERILADQGTPAEPGDALLVHAGRAAWNAEQPAWESLGPRWNALADAGTRPGLHASCMEFIRDTDIAVLMWDMLDLSPSGYSYAWSVHNVISAFGVAVVDNTDFSALLPICRELGRVQFMVTISPLRVVGGTGCPVNPLAIL